MDFRLELAEVTPTTGQIGVDSTPGMRPGGIAGQALAGIDQEVVVTFRYPVRFTRGLFEAGTRHCATWSRPTAARGCWW